MKALPSYLKDTTQLINELNELSIGPNTILVTIDVKSLYTCIPHHDGIEACKEALNSSMDGNPTRPDVSVLICLLEIVLRNNTFEFNDTFYKQLQGTAMGTKLAPAYANIFMGKLERVILSQAPLKPLYYKRYIDDILILWPHSEAELKDFLFSMNSFHPSIKFTYEFSHNKITFLDLDIYKGPHFLTSKKLDIQTHIKPSNRQAYVHSSSHHPPGVGKGVALGEMKRYLRTNSRVSTFNSFKAKHRLNLKKRGYSLKFINHHLNRVNFLDRSFELKPKPKSHNSIIPFITRFSPSAYVAFKIIKKYWPELQHLQQFKNIKIPSPMLSFTSNRNIKSVLVKSKLPSLGCRTEVSTLNHFGLEFTPIPNTTTLINTEDRQSWSQGARLILYLLYYIYIRYRFTHYLHHCIVLVRCIHRYTNTNISPITSDIMLLSLFIVMSSCSTPCPSYTAPFKYSFSFFYRLTCDR